MTLRALLTDDGLSMLDRSALGLTARAGSRLPGSKGLRLRRIDLPDVVVQLVERGLIGLVEVQQDV